MSGIRSTPSDFSSYLLQAQASKAKVIGLANAGGDTINTIKQAAEFGIMKGGQKISPLLVFITDIDSVGLDDRAGTVAVGSLLLGSQRRNPRFLQTLHGADRARAATRRRPASIRR